MEWFSLYNNKRKCTLTKNRIETSRIVTKHARPSIPIRSYDWAAFREDYYQGCPIGHGATEQEAIADLIKQEEEFV